MKNCYSSVSYCFVLSLNRKIVLYANCHDKKYGEIHQTGFLTFLNPEHQFEAPCSRTARNLQRRELFFLSSLANPAAALYATIKDKAARNALAKHFQVPLINYICQINIFCDFIINYLWLSNQNS